MNNEKRIMINLDGKSKNTILPGTLGSGRAWHPWDHLKTCTCGERPFLMYKKDEPYFCGGKSKNVFAECPTCGKYTALADIGTVIDLWNSNNVKEKVSDENF